MNCTTCGYALWNLRTRQCPECGEHFAPSQFEFIHNSVAFCCPNCDQHYFGTGEKGHLVPQEFNCVKCGELVHMDLTVMRPAEGVRERETQVDRLPWLDSEKGWLRRFFATVGMSLVLPHKLGKSMRPEQPLLMAWLFAAIVAIVTVTFMIGPFIAMMFLFMIFDPSGPGAMGMLAGFVGVMAASCVGQLIVIAIWGALSHALLKMTGETAQSIGRTYECICYSSGAYITAGVPCVGAYLGWAWGGIWWTVSAVLMLKEGQRVSGGRAALAGIVPPVLVFALMIGGIAWLITNMVGTFGQAFNPTPPAALATQPTDALTATRDLGQNLNTYSWRNTINHASELIDAGFASPVMFIIDSSDTTLEAVRVGGEDGRHLGEFDVLTDEETSRIVRQAADLLPANVIAHRFGDFVFTYHGIDMSPGGIDVRLWLLIASPDPDSNEAESFNGVFVVSRPWGNVQQILEDRFEEELAAQNRVRTEFGLAPLPHPREVTHAQPAVGEQRASPQRRRRPGP